MRSGAVALVTGASSGIGLAITRRLLEHGLRVIVCGRSVERLNEAFPEESASVLRYALDVTDGAAVAGLLQDLPAAWREIDVLVANAGSDQGGRRRFDEGRIEDYMQTVETNVNGVIRICHAVMPGMLARERGHVVTIGSTSGLEIYVGGTAYATSKHAVHAFTDSLRLDYHTAPIRISEIMPGLVRTGFALARNPGDEEGAQHFYDTADGTLEPGAIADAVMYALLQPPEVNVAQMLVTPTTKK
jgi:NADP-dependent 3-hydroxy acid dehydrogenase YdfG